MRLLSQCFSHPALNGRNHIFQSNFLLLTIGPLHYLYLVSSDLWVKPKPFAAASDDVDAPAVEEANSWASQWIDFGWSPEVVKLITNLSNGASPLALAPGLDWLDKLQNRELLLPEESALGASEFILPLPQESLGQWQGTTGEDATAEIIWLI